MITINHKIVFTFCHFQKHKFIQQGGCHSKIHHNIVLWFFFNPSLFQFCYLFLSNIIKMTCFPLAGGESTTVWFCLSSLPQKRHRTSNCMGLSLRLFQRIWFVPLPSVGYLRKVQRHSSKKRNAVKQFSKVTYFFKDRVLIKDLYYM